ncbi:FTR1 family iron permease [Bifidobacterium sp. B4081]|uniref:FTR1 family iron permease n=1 Tax=unclassified Bifidobacterium TaxID=2608897 RepID=UPI00226AB1B6|nr:MULTISPECIES: FTR1 family protein [unclassified Bifidobacterium]MCX8644632.1 FTR1 family iron permease [Bifidobacterium sp. B4077]MCX8646446.1 FTR1 family iron permease [Bifidobacterium sp. B4081]MCX8668137.1 FTR1 family iron permease [Bifidobacterium sp. B3998]
MVAQVGRTRVARTAGSLLSCLLLALIFLILQTPQSAMAASGAADYDSWTQVADSISHQLDRGCKDYALEDRAGAASQFMGAYNVGYVGSGFVSIVESTLGQDRRNALDGQFQALQGQVYAPDAGRALTQGSEKLKADLAVAATQLDATQGLANPRAYAKAQQEQIKADRRRLDAAKKHRNNGKGDRTWTQVAHEMTPILDQALAQASKGQGQAGSDLVNKAYYQYYEKLGFEKNVMNAISGNRVSQVEYQFKETRMAMVAGKPAKTLVNDLKSMLVEDAAVLDGGAADQVNGWTSFLTSAFGQAFVVLLREGLEAILVVAAIIAYLVKSGHKDKIRHIYWGIAAGLVASGLVALLFTLLFNGNGPQQEILEGVVALVAMLMLLYTSNWMLSKSSVESWNHYIQSRTVAAISKGSVISLALLSFLAVFREGAETVMFYQAIFAMAPGGTREIWTGFAAAAVVLVIVFVLIRFTSVKIPIRPFFIITSLLMAVMVVIFAGGGVHALIEGDLVPATYLPGVPTSDWIGLYPYTQTIGAQILAALVVVVLAIVSTRRLHKQEQAQSNQDSGGSSSATVHQTEAEQAAEGAVPSEVTASMQTSKSEGQS